MSPSRRIDVEPVELDLDPKVKPTRVTRVKPVPIHMQEAVDKCVEDLVKQGVLKGPHTESREWLHSAKFVMKGDGVNVRMTVDMVAMNKAIKRSPVPFISANEMRRSIKSESRFFASLDLTSGYWQIPLTDESTKLCSVLLPQGVFDFLVTIQGMSNSGDHFNRITYEIFKGLLGYNKIALKEIDDIMSQAATVDEIINNLDQLFTRCGENNGTVKRSKIQIGREIPFVGFQVSAIDGGCPQIRMDPKKMEAMKQIPRPMNVKELRSFMGTAVQFSSWSTGYQHSAKLLN